MGMEGFVFGIEEARVACTILGWVCGGLFAGTLSRVMTP